MTDTTLQKNRQVVFICKATPGDDEFVLWLAPRLEAAGYTVFADILTLEPGDRWRKIVTGALQNDVVKMLLCCRDSTLGRNGVQEEIGIAEDLVKELGDPQFVIPLRLERYKKVFGIGELQFVDFLGGWAQGLRDLLDALERQGVPCDPKKISINPNWENYRKRLAITIEDTPETLTSNWLQIVSLPDVIYYYQPRGAVNHIAMERACKHFAYPAEFKMRGFFSFAAIDEIEQDFTSVGRFEVTADYPLMEFMEKGCELPKMRPREAKNMVSSMFRQGWENHCRKMGLYEYAFSNQVAFHASEEQIAIGKKIPWGREGRRRSSMLRNIARGKVWQYGVSANPLFWPYPHFRMKARVVFAELASGKAGAVIADDDKQHRYRRTICKGWRNKQWHGRLIVFLTMLRGESEFIELKLSSTAAIKLDASPICFTSPVSTSMVDEMPNDGEEADLSTLGNFFLEEEN